MLYKFLLVASITPSSYSSISLKTHKWTEIYFHTRFGAKVLSHHRNPIQATCMHWVSWKRKQLLSKQITQSYQQGNLPWTYEAIFVYKQAEKALTPIYHLLCCLFFYNNILIIILKKRRHDRWKLKYVLWAQACIFGMASLKHSYIRFHVLLFG